MNKQYIYIRTAKRVNELILKKYCKEKEKERNNVKSDDVPRSSTIRQTGTKESQVFNCCLST
ncbi:hypothetical protein OAV88_01130 [bacterium]|nr:hypothetical protein [bacterium]